MARNRPRPIPMRAQLSRVSGSGSEFRLRVEDEASGTILAELFIDEMAFADLMSTREAKVFATHLVVAENLTTIGKRSVVHVESVPRERLEGTGYGSPAREQAGAEWAESRANEMYTEGDGYDWNVQSVRVKSAGGVEVIFVRYEEVTF